MGGITTASWNMASGTALPCRHEQDPVSSHGRAPAGRNAPSRRQFLHAMAGAGGYSAAYLSMQAMGLLATPAHAQTVRPDLPAGSGTGRHVIILGAGIAGLVAAYELGRAGYRTTVLEARGRVGGRVWSVRGGDRVEQTGRADQFCRFENGLSFDAGAARLPAAHTTMIGYARQLAVPLEAVVTADHAARWAHGGDTVTKRQAVNDTRGRIAELLDKALAGGSLDAQVTPADRERLRTYLTEWGALGKDGRYTGSSRSGYAIAPGGYDHPPQAMDPLTLHQILENGFWDGDLSFGEQFDEQAPMLQPVGGMDRIAEALYARVRDGVRLGTPVTAVGQLEHGVRVVLADGGMVDGDYVLCTLPAPLVRKLTVRLSAAKKKALAGARYAAATAVAWEAPRFWQDAGIMGGRAFVDGPEAVVRYPSGGWGDPRGILAACYDAGEAEAKIAALTTDERFAAAAAMVERLHPGKASLLQKPLTVSWAQTPWSEGATARWTPEQLATDYLELCKPEGRLFFAGEHLSYLGGWQEGAALSALEAVRLLATRAAGDKVVAPKKA